MKENKNGWYLFKNVFFCLQMFLSLMEYYFIHAAAVQAVPHLIVPIFVRFFECIAFKLSLVCRHNIFFDSAPREIAQSWRLIDITFCLIKWSSSEPQIRQFCLLTYPPRWKWYSSEKIIYCKITFIVKFLIGPINANVAQV